MLSNQQLIEVLKTGWPVLSMYIINLTFAFTHNVTCNGDRIVHVKRILDRLLDYAVLIKRSNCQDWLVNKNF